MPLSQYGALRCSPFAARLFALFPSRSPVPCAVPLSQRARRLALSRLSPPGAFRCPPRYAERHVDTRELWEQRWNLVHERRTLWPAKH
eukprot:2873751-Pleurochrysis_carterae.AAC.1